MIAATHIAIPGTDVPVRITISGGIAMYPSNGQSTTGLFRVADDALYESKRNGRNRILVAPSAGLAGEIAKGPDAGPEALKPGTMSNGPEPGTLDLPLGEFGGNLRE